MPTRYSEKATTKKTRSAVLDCYISKSIGSFHIGVSFGRLQQQQQQHKSGALHPHTPLKTNNHKMSETVDYSLFGNVLTKPSTGETANPEQVMRNKVVRKNLGKAGRLCCAVENIQDNVASCISHTVFLSLSFSIPARFFYILVHIGGNVSFDNNTHLQSS